MIQVRVPKGLLRMIDELKKRGIYRSRSEAVVDGLRHVVLKYRFVGGWATYTPCIGGGLLSVTYPSTTYQ